MRKMIAMCLGFIAMSSISFAATKSPVEFGAKSSVKVSTVVLSDTVKIGALELKRVASGLRYKKVLFANFDVYVGQVFSKEKPSQTSIGSMKDSLLKTLPVVLSLTFLRDVGADKLSNGFKETLEGNGVDVKQSSYHQFLDAVITAGEMKKGESYLLAIGSEGNTVSLSAHGYEFYHLSEASPEVMNGFMSLWFGKAPDSGLESLQKDLLKP